MAPHTHPCCRGSQLVPNAQQPLPPPLHPGGWGLVGWGLVDTPLHPCHVDACCRARSQAKRTRSSGAAPSLQWHADRPRSKQRSFKNRRVLGSGGGRKLSLVPASKTGADAWQCVSQRVRAMRHADVHMCALTPLAACARPRAPAPLQHPQTLAHPSHPARHGHSDMQAAQCVLRLSLPALLAHPHNQGIKTPASSQAPTSPPRLGKPPAKKPAAHKECPCQSWHLATIITTVPALPRTLPGPHAPAVQLRPP